MQTPNLRQELAAGINWAWQNGADVISNSWAHDALIGSYITDAIDRAVTYGRSGLGCIIAFCAQNQNFSIVYPATLPNVIAVGAISPCGERKSPSSCDTETGWGSNYGLELDIVAPGVLISTTDIQGLDGYNPNFPIHLLYGGSIISNDYTDPDYTAWFGGTSAACPHAAGVAALVLSVNPNLTGQQVRNIIESTAQKVRPDLYNYAIEPGRPNGTWHEEMGYGLVDAYAAVSAAVTGIIGPITICSTGGYKLIDNVPATWTVTPSGAFSITAQNNTSATVTALVLNGAAGTLMAITSSNTFTYAIQACNAAISGTSTICASASYTLIGAQADLWEVNPGSAFTLTAQGATSATVTALELNGQAGTLTAWINSIAVDYPVQACEAIIGPDAICSTGIYTLDNGLHTDFWMVSPYSAFTVTEQSATSAIVTALYPGRNGTLTVMLNGTMTHKAITTCSYTLSGPSTLCDCSDNYYPNNLPSGVSQGTWTVTNNNLLQAIGNGASGCTLTRVAELSSDTDVFDGSPPINIYPQGEAELIFQFEWNGDSYSVSKTISFGVRPSIEGIIEDSYGLPVLYSNEADSYVLMQLGSYYFTADGNSGPCSYTYRWVVSSEENQAYIPSLHFGSSTQNDPVTFGEEGYYNLSLSVADGCGFGRKLHQLLYLVQYQLLLGPIYLLSPNPFSSYINFNHFVLGPCFPPSSNSVNEIRIYGIPKGPEYIFCKGCDFCAQSFTIFPNLPTGWYLVQLIQNNQVIQSTTMLCY